MEENTNKNDDVIIEKTPSKYVLGTIGALIGGFIAAIPWILVYVFGNMIWSLLAIFIAVGALKGYQIFKGTINKKLPYIIAIVSLLVIIVTTLVISPMLLLAKEDFIVNFSNLKLLYSDTEFKEAILYDLILSIIFTILGISGVVSNINRALKNGVNGKISVSEIMSNNNNVVSNEDLQKVKEIFERFNAVDKEHTIDKNTILQELDELPNGRVLFAQLKLQKIICKSKGKYYFCEKPLNSKPNKKSTIIWVIVLVIFISAIIAFGNLDDTNTNTTNNVSNTNTSAVENVVDNTYLLEDANMKIMVPENMNIISGTDLDSVFGTGASEIYKFIIYDNTTTLTCFIDDQNNNTVETYVKSLEDALKEQDLEVITSVSTQTISDFDFTYIELQLTSNDVLMNELCMVYAYDNKFLCLDYSYKTDDSKTAKENLKNIIQKID